MNKNQKAILEKLGIEQLNEMQLAAEEAILSHAETVLLSPTGTGKTVAFLLPILSLLDTELEAVQVLILVPARELAMQIEQVLRTMGSGFKVNAVYGGRSGSKDKYELKHAPAILVGTPGRVADHIRRGNVTTEHIKTLVLDEFDKSLEIGFEKEMREILASLKKLNKKVLTSATQQVEIPEFVELRRPEIVDFLTEEKKQNLDMKLVLSPKGDKRPALKQLLAHLGQSSGIVFCNLKGTIQSVSEYLTAAGVPHACFYGGLEQIDRERSLLKFRNGTYRILLATDLAARGIDVPELDYIIHYELPFKEEEFIHRNGRTARMHASGTAYLMKAPKEYLPAFTKGIEEMPLPEEVQEVPVGDWETLFISGGRKDKISKGDIAGLFMKQGALEKDELGVIELKNDCAFVAVKSDKAQEVCQKLNNSKLKNKKVRVSVLER